MRKWAFHNLATLGSLHPVQVRPGMEENNSFRFLRQEMIVV